MQETTPDLTPVRQVRAPLARTTGLGLAALLGLGAVLALPPRINGLQSRRNPTGSYAEARTRFERLAARDGAEVNPVCRSMLFEHGATTESAVVLLHGMTNCPLQFKAFGAELHQRGHTVLVPRLPRNGLSDRRTAELGRLTAAECTTFSDEIVDIAAGFGRRITVLGLSAGGTLAAWIAQERSEVARTVVVAPFFGISTFAPAYQALMRNAFLRLPNIMLDDGAEEVLRKPAHNYVRKATRSFGALMVTGEYVLRAARRSPPATSEVVLVSNAADVVVNRELIALLAERWRQHAPGRVSQFEFAASDGLAHDIIDPLQPTARVEYVYPILMEYIDRT